MLRHKRNYFPLQDPPEFSEKQVSTSTYLDGDFKNIRASIVDVNHEKIDSSVLDPDVVNAERVLTSGNYIGGSTEFNPSDVATLESIGQLGVQSILDGSGLTDINHNFKE